MYIYIYIIYVRMHGLIYLPSFLFVVATSSQTSGPCRCSLRPWCVSLIGATRHGEECRLAGRRFFGYRE